jgi:hypothetical protein
MPGTGQPNLSPNGERTSSPVPGTPAVAARAIGVLREEVWQTGQTRRSLQSALPTQLALVTAGGSVLAGIFASIVLGDALIGLFLVVGLILFGVVPVVMAAILCRGAGAIYGTIALRRLRRQLRSVPPEARRATLAIFCTAGDEARDLAEALLRDVHGPTELTPSAAPTSRGSELTSAPEGDGPTDDGAPSIARQTPGSWM